MKSVAVNPKDQVLDVQGEWLCQTTEASQHDKSNLTAVAVCQQEGRSLVPDVNLRWPLQRAVIINCKQYEETQKNYNIPSLFLAHLQVDKLKKNTFLEYLIFLA